MAERENGLKIFDDKDVVLSNPLVLKINLHKSTIAGLLGIKLKANH
jgi:hypothetical protein